LGQKEEAEVVAAKAITRVMHNVQIYGGIRVKV
jgi:hypothetical protein